MLFRPACWFVLLAVAAVGCGRSSPHSAEAVERGQRALEVALESWKKGEPASRLKTMPEPIEFSDDARTVGQRLLDYRLLGTNPADPEVIRYTVVLTLQDRRGQRSEREVTYSVALKSPIVIARDPYF